MSQNTELDQPLQTFIAYGLGVRSSIPLTEFVSTEDGRPHQVTVTFGQDSGWIAKVRPTRRSFEICGMEARFWFEGVGGFIVRNGSDIIIIPESGVDYGILRLYVQGMMMAMVLHQRGLCVLHASVVDINGVAVALTGQIGAGKSSLAAALYARGHRIVTDDNAAVDMTSSTPVVIPAYPFLKLYPAIAAALGFENGAVRPLHVSQTKITGTVTRFAQRPLPLHSIYVLGRDHGPTPARLSPLPVVMELIRNSVPTRWGCAGDAQQLQQCGTIAKVVPTFTLRTFSDLDSLPRVAETVERATDRQIDRSSAGPLDQESRSLVVETPH